MKEIKKEIFSVAADHTPEKMVNCCFFTKNTNMKQIVIIDTKTEIGKSVVELLGVLAHNNSSISFLTDEEIEKKEDEVMAEMIRTGIESGKGDKNELFEYLDIKECK